MLIEQKIRRLPVGMDVIVVGIVMGVRLECIFLLLV